MLDNELITRETNVFEALDRAPDGRMLFRQDAFNPELECGILTRVLTLGEATNRCGIRNLPRLLKQLNASTTKNAQHSCQEASQ
jgi:hypothetical protein